MNVLDLFSGIGGFSLGLERAGMRTVAFCEIDPFCRRVLAKHWPSIPCYDDVRLLTADRLKADGIAVDAICGGFPCQDISTAGKGAGIAEGTRSGLWSEYARIIGEVRPRYVIVENVAALLGRGLDRVLGDLAALGFDAEWHCIPASAIGAPHRRDRLWLVAYPNGAKRRSLRGACNGLAGPDCLSQGQESSGRFAPSGEDVADANADLHALGLVRGTDPRAPGRSEGGNTRQGSASHGERVWSELGSSSPHVAHAEQGRLATWDEQHHGSYPILLASGSCERGRDRFGETWRTEPNVGRVAHGVPFGMERIQGLGNAVVPQIPEIIGRAIMQAEATDRTMTAQTPAEARASREPYLKREGA